jgi:hypothetical protein
MQIALVCPIPDLERFAIMGNRHLLFMEAIGTSNPYTLFYKNRKEPKIVNHELLARYEDNFMDELLFKVKLVDADIVVAPDCRLSAEDTVRMAEIFYKKVFKDNDLRSRSGLKRLEILGIPQANCRKDFLWCYKRLLEIGVTRIGLSKEACPASFGEYTVEEQPDLRHDRIMAYRALSEVDIWNKKFQHHLVGLGGHVDEVNYFSSLPEIVSIDTCSPIFHGALGIRYHNGCIPGAERLQDWSLEQAVPSENYKIVEENILELRQRALFSPSQYSEASTNLMYPYPEIR